MTNSGTGTTMRGRSGSAAEAVIIYADLETGQNVSRVWNDLSDSDRIRIQSGGALISVIAAPAVAVSYTHLTLPTKA